MDFDKRLQLRDIKVLEFIMLLEIVEVGMALNMLHTLDTLEFIALMVVIFTMMME